MRRLMWGLCRIQCEAGGERKQTAKREKEQEEEGEDKEKTNKWQIATRWCFEGESNEILRN